MSLAGLDAGVCGVEPTHLGGAEGADRAGWVRCVLYMSYIPQVHSHC